MAYFQSAAARSHLVPIFQLHFGYFFPFLHTEALLALDSNTPTLPAYVINTVCALAARYSPIFGNLKSETSVSQADGRAKDLWASKAKEQVHKDLAVASIGMVQALLLISWYEFGEDRDTVSNNVLDYGL